jgi:hypothetical protein
MAFNIVEIPPCARLRALRKALSTILKKEALPEQVRGGPYKIIETPDLARLYLVQDLATRGAGFVRGTMGWPVG